MSLSEKSCVPCKGGVPPLAGSELNRFLQELNADSEGGWKAIEGHHLRKVYEFPDFLSALAFTNRIGALAEAEGHHPDIHLAWGKVGVEIWTHKIDGLTESDFVLAAKTDNLPR
jgi:4a-hydroxytetrahydrobiopterin dehydratase